MHARHVRVPSGSKFHLEPGTIQMCSSVSYCWSIGCWQQIISVVSYDRGMCYPLSHKSLQCIRSRGVSLALMNPFLWWSTTMKNISLSSRYKRAKAALILSAGQKWVRLEREYLHSYWIFDANIWTSGGKVGDLSANRRILFCSDQVINCFKTAKLMYFSS